MPYILAIDQSTSGTKGMIFSTEGELLCRCDLPHRQITNNLGYVEHDPDEIYRNTVDVAGKVLEKYGIDGKDIAAVGISNQRETVVCWDAQTGKPVCNAIVWQCGRAADICRTLQDRAEEIFQTTGLNLSPYFSAPKMAWIVRNIPAAAQLLREGRLRFGTVDAWLVYRLTGGEAYKTDYSNASRTGLMNIDTCEWDEEIVRIYGLDRSALPGICFSDSLFGYTDFEGLLPKKLPICGVMGDSHAALFAHGCIRPGMTKVTFGTGSSVMMNTGEKKVVPKPGVVASLAWGREGKITYALEGNINYTGAVIKWLVDDVQLIQSAEEAGTLSESINDTGGVYFVPAFTGLGAPYWNNDARALLCGMNPATGKTQIVRAAVECIGYQIRDVVDAMGGKLPKIMADGGPTRNAFLMQFVAGILDIPVEVSGLEELSGAGAAYMAALSFGVSSMERLYSKRITKTFVPDMGVKKRERLCMGWTAAVKMLEKQA